MKTADRILLISLELFNLHGEANISSVDIATELEISPGNLYYHFKGKEIIISSLFELYQQRMNKVLLSPKAKELTIDEFFYYLFLVFEISHDFRFLYRNPAELQEKYPQTAKGFRRILATKEKTFKNCLRKFNQQGLLIGDPAQQQKMLDLINLIATQTTNYQLLKGNNIDSGEYIYQSLGMILFALSPYINIEKDQFEELHRSMMSYQLE